MLILEHCFMIIHNNECLVNLSNKLTGIDDFLNDLDNQQRLSRGINESNELVYKYDHLPHFNEGYSLPVSYFETMYNSIQELLRFFKLDTSVADDLMVICSSYKYIQSTLHNKLKQSVGAMDDAKLLVKLLLVPFQTESVNDLDDMDDEAIHNYLMDFRRDKALKYIKNGVLDRSLIEPEFFSILSKLEKGIKIDVQSTDLKGNQKWYYILFSRLISSNLSYHQTTGKRSFSLTKAQNQTLLRGFLKELLTEQAKRDTDFFKVIREPLFNNNRQKLLIPFINGRESATHNQILKSLTATIGKYLTRNNLMPKPKRRGQLTTEAKVFIFYLYSLQSLVLVNKLEYLNSPEELHEIVKEFKSLSKDKMALIASKFNEIIK